MKISHPEKILYVEGKITKQELIAYYQQVQNYILPYIKNRLLALVRCPRGYQKGCFFQKHINAYADVLHTIAIQEKTKIDDSVYITNAAGLLTLAQLSTLEIHIWNCRITNIEAPDMIVFDLDPGPRVAWTAIVEAAFEVKQRLEKMELKSFVKSTGGAGLHVVLPIKPNHSWEAVKTFTHTFVEEMAADYPKKYVSQMAKERRIGKIFLDYLRNQRGATSIAPYSTRARKHATVATPLAWNELTDKIADTTFTIKTLPERLQQLRRDPWRDFLKLKQTLRL